MDIELLKKHIDKLNAVFPGLRLSEKMNGRYSVIGNLNFTVKYNGNTIKDDYDIEIIIPDTYPQCPPTVQEVGNKIFQCPDNHIYGDGTFCFGAPLAVRYTFSQYRDLLWFVREQVVRFLFNHSYKRDFGIRPDGELSHGPKGLLEYYYELLNTQDNVTVMEFLRLLSENRYDDQSSCPCGSGRKIRRCHYRLIKKIRKLSKPEEFKQEFASIISYLSLQRWLLVNENTCKD
jgi:hypothetical protein